MSNGEVVFYQKPCSSKHIGQGQKGVVLIVCLVMLVILTAIAVGTVTDTNLQTNMARNRQIGLQAYNVALSELRAQFQSAKDNEEVPSKSITYQQFLSDVYQTETPADLAAADLKMPSADNPFEQAVRVEFIRIGVCGGGNQLPNSALIFEITGTADLDNTGINSDQTLGICYPNPGAQQ